MMHLKYYLKKYKVKIKITKKLLFYSFLFIKFGVLAVPKIIV